jgi:hypothetical protein
MAHENGDKVQASAASIEEPAYVFERGLSVGVEAESPRCWPFQLCPQLPHSI